MPNNLEIPDVNQWTHQTYSTADIKTMKSHKGICLAAEDIFEQKRCAGYPEGAKSYCPHLAYDYLRCSKDRRQC
ncbi:MAG: hypothetical protein WC373_13465 [Smithella sp.]